MAVNDASTLQFVTGFSFLADVVSLNRVIGVFRGENFDSPGGGG